MSAVPEAVPNPPDATAASPTRNGTICVFLLLLLIPVVAAAVVPTKVGAVVEINRPTLAVLVESLPRLTPLTKIEASPIV